MRELNLAQNQGAKCWTVYQGEWLQKNNTVGRPKPVSSAPLRRNSRVAALWRSVRMELVGVFANPESEWWIKLFDQRVCGAHKCSCRFLSTALLTSGRSHGTYQTYDSLIATYSGLKILYWSYPSYKFKK